VKQERGSSDASPVKFEEIAKGETEGMFSSEVPSNSSTRKKKVETLLQKTEAP
jgi:hypothetical protein